MIIPHGLTINIGRREYREGDKLPNKAPEAVKQQVRDYIAKLDEKDKEPESIEKTEEPESPDSEGEE